MSPTVRISPSRSCSSPALVSSRASPDRSSPRSAPLARAASKPRALALACAAAVCATPLLAAPRTQLGGGASTAAWTQHGATPCGRGRWEPPYDHEIHQPGFVTAPLSSPLGGRFNAVHMSLIPAGPHRGKVLVWDRALDTASSAQQRWAIVDPSPFGDAVFLNFSLAMPNGQGDLFCSGHAWTSNGDLFVAGGTTVYPSARDASSGFAGGKLAYVYDVDAGPNGAWKRQTDLVDTRWYPTVLHAGTDELLVLGGVGDTEGHARNNYEVFDASALAWKVYGDSTLLEGPREPAAALTYYPRTHWLSDGTLFTAGQQACSARLAHALAPGIWEVMRADVPWYLEYNASILLQDDVVLRVGGELELDAHSEGYLSMSQTCPATADGAAWVWSFGATLQRERSQFNAVLLPDGGVLVLGGIRAGPLHTTELLTQPELLAAPGGPWLSMAPAASARPYHATAVLLPNGKVLSAGGDERHYDYQVFVPPYLECGAPRPIVASAPQQLVFAASADARAYTLELANPAEAHVESVVLLAPGAVTHHSDSNQRRVVLPIVARTASSVSFLGPASPHHAPPGYYMLFALTEHGVPSQAEFVRVGP